MEIVNSKWFLDFLPGAIVQYKYSKLNKTVSTRWVYIDKSTITENTIALFKVYPKDNIAAFSQEAEMRMPQPEIAA